MAQKEITVATTPQPERKPITPHEMACRNREKTVCSHALKEHNHVQLDPKELAKRRSYDVTKHFRKKETGPRTEQAHAARMSGPPGARTGLPEKPKNARPAWVFFAHTTKEKAVEGAHEGKSCYLVHLGKEAHQTVMESFKNDRDIVHLPNHVPRQARNPFFTDPLTPIQRAEFQMSHKLKAQHAKRNESGIQQRRIADGSVETLDNTYRQQMDRKTAKPIITGILEGDYYCPDREQPKRGVNFLAQNRRFVRVASAVVGGARSSRVL